MELGGWRHSELNLPDRPIGPYPGLPVAYGIGCLGSLGWPPRFSFQDTLEQTAGLSFAGAVWTLRFVGFLQLK